MSGSKIYDYGKFIYKLSKYQLLKFVKLPYMSPIDNCIGE